MFRTLRAAFFGSFLLIGCGGPDLPNDLSCEGEVRSASNDEELGLALSSGDCLVIEAGTYSSALNISTPGVIVAAADGASVELSSSDVGLRISAADVRVFGLRVRGGRYGIVSSASNIELNGVVVEGASAAAVWIKCEDSGCTGGTGAVLNDVSISASLYGLYVDGSSVRVNGGRIWDNNSQQLSGGAGVYVVGGGSLSIEGTTIEQNGYGIVADGAATRLSLVSAVILRNEELGVWGQGLRGTITQPALEVRGVGSRIEDNGVVGLGAFDSAGVVARDVSIARTIEKEVLIDLTRLVRIGDGVSLLAGAANVSIENVRMTDNQRAQAVVDAAGNGVAFGTNVVSGGREKVVVQNGGGMVVVPAADASSPAMELPVFEAALAVPVLTP